jgi:hypothetical protein
MTRGWKVLLWCGETEDSLKRNLLLDHSCDHGGAGSHAELGEDAAQVRADGPNADIQDGRDGFVWVTLGDHPGDFSFARTERHGLAVECFDEQTADAVDFAGEQNLFSFGGAFGFGRLGRAGSAGLSDKLADQHLRGGGQVSRGYFALTCIGCLGRHIILTFLHHFPGRVTLSPPGGFELLTEVAILLAAHRRKTSTFLSWLLDW